MGPQGFEPWTDGLRSHFLQIHFGNLGTTFDPAGRGHILQSRAFTVSRPARAIYVEAEAIH